MQFDDSQTIEAICFSMRQSDWGRSRNRALINSTFNGFQPFTEQEIQDNGINVSFNDMTAVRKAHDARGQMYSGILKPGNYFRAVADIGPLHDRTRHSDTVTRHANRLMKRSRTYYELQRAKIAQSILHGTGMSVWANRESWCPGSISIEDVLIPSGKASELPMDNLPLFALHKSFTAPDLIKLTRGPNTDKAWNMDVVNACLKWIDDETATLMRNNWPDMWSPEKQQERIKEGGYYGGDSVPTIEAYDFYWWHDNGKESGWKRRMIIDPWGTPSVSGNSYAPARKKGGLYDKKELKGQFLFDPKDRIYAQNKSEIISFQFADLSAVAPFRYHTLRGLGFLIHDACVIQNRLTCKITEATFETLTMLMRVKSQEDVQRALKANLFNQGFVDETVQFIPAAERWQVNTGLVEYGYNKTRELIDQGSSSMSQNQDMSKGIEKGQLQIMAELNATTAMLSAGLLQYYQYQVDEYREIFRRLLNRNAACSDPQVNLFRAACLRDEVPPEMLADPEAWDIEPERVMGAGNKTLEMSIAQQLLSMRPLYDPPAQRVILRDATLAFTDDPARADQLVPEEPRVSDTVHDTELVFSALMRGDSVTPADGLNAVEVAVTIIKEMQAKVAEIMQTDGMGTPADIKGLSLAAGYSSHYLKILEQDKNSKQTATELSGALAKIGNEVKGMQQRQQQAAQQAAQQSASAGGGLDPETQAKIATTQAESQAKIEQGQASHAQKTAQREITFQNKMQQDQAKHALELEKSNQQHTLEIEKMRREHAAELEKKDLEALANIEIARKQAAAQATSGANDGKAAE